MRYRTKKSLLRAAGCLVWPMILIGITVAGTAEIRCELAQAPSNAVIEPAKPVVVELEQEAAVTKLDMVIIEDPQLVEYEEPDTEPPYTEDELEALALAIYQEAGSDKCSDEARLMVGAVVLNRVADERFPDSIEEVLLQERQYGRLHWTGLVWPERAAYPSEAHAVERAYTAAEALLSGSVVDVLPPDVIFQAEFVQGSEVVAQTDGFYFCR